MKFGCVLIFMVPTNSGFVHQKWVSTFGEVLLRTYIHGSNTPPQPILPQIALPAASRWGHPCNSSNIQCSLCAGSTLSIHTNLHASKADLQIGPTWIRTTNHSYGDWAHNLLHQKWITTIGEVWLRTYIHGSNIIIIIPLCPN